MLHNLFALPLSMTKLSVRHFCSEKLSTTAIKNIPALFLIRYSDTRNHSETFTLHTLGNASVFIAVTTRRYPGFKGIITESAGLKPDFFCCCCCFNF